MNIYESDLRSNEHGFKSYTGLNFFSGLIFTTAQVVFISEKITFIFTSLSTVQIYDFHIFTVIDKKQHLKLYVCNI